MTPPPPGGPRDWSPHDVDVREHPPIRPGMPPIRGAGHIEGLGWARLLGWVSLAIGCASTVLVLIAPLAGDLSRVAWIVAFGGFAIWFGLMAEPRFRSALGRGSTVSKLGVALGIATIAIAIYAFTAIMLSGYGTRIPAPAHWLTPGVGTVAGVPTNTMPTFVSVVPPTADAATAPQSPVEAERLTLGQSVGTAVYVLEQTATSDGTWPASLAVTTDATTLMTPDGITLAPLLPGAQVLYSTSTDLREFSLTIIGPLGAVATYESTTGTIASSAP